MVDMLPRLLTGDRLNERGSWAASAPPPQLSYRQSKRLGVAVLLMARRQLPPAALRPPSLQTMTRPGSWLATPRAPVVLHIPPPAAGNGGTGSAPGATEPAMAGVSDGR